MKPYKRLRTLAFIGAVSLSATMLSVSAETFAAQSVAKVTKVQSLSDGKTTNNTKSHGSLRYKKLKEKKKLQSIL
ncbi:MAG: hypothetical protein JWN37_73 [Candidatus Nomurabacteria bacterium]|nr:hypothetical protein [Candidatus Nomurabacteria bacterium]